MHLAMTQVHSISKLILLQVTLNMNAYIIYKVDGTRYVLHTDLTRTDGHFKIEDSISDDESEHDEDYCHGCETGADCAHAHTEACNRERGFT